MLKRIGLAAAGVWLAFMGGAQAQTMNWGEEYARRIKATEAVSPLGDAAFGDQVNLFNGTTSFSATDISLPGNSALPVQLSRSFDTQSISTGGAIGGWDIDTPYLVAIHPENAAGNWAPLQRCSTVAAPPDVSMPPYTFTAREYWSGTQLKGVGGGGTLLEISTNPRLVKPTTPGVSFKWNTKGGWYFSCLPALQNGQGEGFVGLAPDGTKYTFDWMTVSDYPGISFQAPTGMYPAFLSRKSVRLVATQVEDRFGNWVKYDWTNNRLNRIYANDGREIVLSYTTDGRLQTAVAAGRTWTYEYDPVYTLSLANVVNPDGSRWQYAFQGPGSMARVEYSQQGGGAPLECTYMSEMVQNTAGYSIVHPSGAKAEFTFAPKRHGRTNVPYACMPGVNPDDLATQDDYNDISVFHDVMSLQSKRITGPGLPDATYSYAYSGLEGAYADYGSPTPPPHHKVVTLTEPDGTQTINWFGKDYDLNEGQLLYSEVRKGGVLYKSVSQAYVTEAEIPSQLFPDKVGVDLTYGRDEFNSAALRPRRNSTINLDGVSYNKTINGYDAFARPSSATNASTISGGYSRGEVTTYHDDLSKWVLGQVAAFSTGGAVPSQTDYDPATALPIRNYTFGVLRQTLTYNADGTIATVKDGNNNVIVLSNWKRGVPQTIQYPATAESPSGSSESAVVNDAGWITSVTDENGAGYTTNYGYDAMGRLASIAYPTGDDVSWNATTFSFQQINEEEFGIPAGHWRHVTSRGNYQKVTVFDALWRPLWEYQRDLGNGDATFSVINKSYDSVGRQIFASYPRNPLADGNWAINTGTRTTYDALGRATKVEQDSELGSPVTTSTEYLAGGEVRTTNPRGQQTRTRYAAWDQPTTDYPIEIFHPEGAVTQISRELGFLKPTQIRRYGTYSGQTVEAIRRYYYDGAHRLCRTDEPETGSTVMGHDYNDNLTWSTSGLTTLNNVDCDQLTAYPAGRTVTRSYDARNRLHQMSFPDGLGNQTWTYTKDGLPASITTYNGANSTDAVVNTYGYNKRRLLTSETISEPGAYTWSLGYGYDQNGNLAAQTYPTGLALTYAPNALGQATQVGTAPTSTTSGTYASGVSYYPNGAIKQFTYGNGIVHTMTQNARQLPQVTQDGSIVGFTNTYDANGNTTGIDDTAQGVNFNRYLEYDGLDRLTRASSAMFGGSHHRIDYAYDAIDNLRAVTNPGVREHSYWYDANNRLTNVQNSGGASVVGLSYDVQGNLNNKNGQQYGFDYGNRLRWVMGKESYRYDGLGRRTKINKDNGVQQWFQYSQAGQYLFGSTLTAAGVQTTQENVYLGGSVIATVEHNWPSNTVIATKYQHTDALGSPVATTDASGALIERTNYEPYGSVINKTVDGIGYTGHVMDGATGLTYMQQRYYDPTIGRFLSVDPITANGSTGNNFNRYWYASNNSYRFFDPDGREDKEKQVRPDRRSLDSCLSCRGANGSSVSLHGESGKKRSDAQSSNAEPAGPGSVFATSAAASEAADDFVTELNGGPVMDALFGDPYLVNITPVGDAFTYTLTPMNAGMPPAFGLRGAASGLRGAASAGSTVFRTAHYAARLEAAGLNVARTQVIIAREAARIRQNLSVGGDVVGRMRVNGVLIEYRMRAMPNGSINVGTIFPVK